MQEQTSTYRVCGLELNYSSFSYDKRTFLEQGLQTGHALWPCARLLSDFLSENPSIVANKRVLELGCGLGLCGSVAAVLGARQVVFTDADAAVLDKCQAFASHNLAGVSSAELAFKELSWCGTSAVNVDDGFDVVLGSDLLYGRVPKGEKDDRAHQLVKFAMSALSKIGREGRFLLAFERRETVSLEDFEEAARALGITCTTPEGEWIEDIFANRTENHTDFWRACVLEFRLASSQST